MDKAKRRQIKSTECKWRTSPLDPCCAASVNYRDLVGGENHGWMARLPCLPDSPLQKGPVAKCEKYEAKTQEELEAEEKEQIERGKNLVAALTIIKADGKLSGVVKCPKCSRELHYTKAKSNGHIWGKCETAGCLSWMM